LEEVEEEGGEYQKGSGAVPLENRCGITLISPWIEPELHKTLSLK